MIYILLSLCAYVLNYFDIFIRKYSKNYVISETISNSLVLYKSHCSYICCQQTQHKMLMVHQIIAEFELKTINCKRFSIKSFRYKNQLHNRCISSINSIYCSEQKQCQFPQKSNKAEQEHVIATVCVIYVYVVGRAKSTEIFIEVERI